MALHSLCNTQAAQDFEKAISLDPGNPSLYLERGIAKRELIHQTGVKTFPRPPGIPENFRIQISDRGASMKYVHPEHTHTSIRFMPGKPHSRNPAQQKPYVTWMKNGNVFNKRSLEDHIPIKEFIYGD